MVWDPCEGILKRKSILFARLLNFLNKPLFFRLADGLFNQNENWNRATGRRIGFGIRIEDEGIIPSLFPIIPSICPQNICTAYINKFSFAINVQKFCFFVQFVNIGSGINLPQKTWILVKYFHIIIISYAFLIT